MSAEDQVTLTVIAIDRFTGRRVNFRIREIEFDAGKAVGVPLNVSSMHLVKSPRYTKLNIAADAEAVPFGRMVAKGVFVSSQDQLVVLTVDSLTADFMPGADVVDTVAIIPTSECRKNEFQWLSVAELGGANVIRNVVLRGCRAQIGLLRPGRYAVQLYNGTVPVRATQLSLESAIGRRKIEVTLAF